MDFEANDLLMNLYLAIIWFLVGFVLVNGLKALHILGSGKRQKKKSVNKNVNPAQFTQSAYRKSLPYTPVYYLTVWMLCSTFYFLQHTPANIYKDALLTGIFWWLLTLLLEMLLWTVVRHRFQLTPKEMYMHSQPWISLAYYAVLISPLVLSMILA